MSKSVFFVFVLLILILGLACGSAVSTNSNSTQNTNTTVSTNVNLPPGMSTSPVPPSTNTTPGIPDANNVTNVQKGAGPTPGIDPKTAVRTMKPGEKIPGIPDAATMKRQMSQPVDPSKLPPEFRGVISGNSNQPQMMKKKP